MKIIFIPLFIFLIQLKSYGMFVPQKKPSQQNLQKEYLHQNSIPSNSPEKFKDEFLKMDVKVLPPIVKLSDPEIKWNQQFDQIIQKEIKEPLPKFNELDPRLAIFEKEKVEISPKEYSELLKIFFSNDRQELKEKLEKEKLLDSKEAKRLKYYNDIFSIGIDQLEDCLTNGSANFKIKTKEELLNTIKNYRSNFKDCIDLVAKVKLIIEHVENWDEKFKELLKNNQHILNPTNISNVVLSRTKFDGVQIKQYNIEMDTKKYQIKSNMTPELKGFISDMQKVVTKSQYSLDSKMTPQEILEFDAELAKLYFLSDYLNVEELGACTSLKEVEQFEKARKGDKHQPQIMFDKLYSIDISSLLDSNIDPKLQEKWNDEILTIKKMSEDPNLDYFLFKEKNRDGWSIMVKDRNPGSLAPYRIVEFKPSDNQNKFKPQTYDLNTPESKIKKTDLKINEIESVSEPDIKNSGKIDVLVLLGKTMGVSSPWTLFDIRKQIKAEAGPESNWHGTDIGFQMNPNQLGESSFFTSIGGKTDNDNFSISTGAFMPIGDLASGQFLPQTKLTIDAELKNNTELDSDIWYNLNNQAGFARFVLDGSEKSNLLFYDKPSYGKLGNIYFETFTKDPKTNETHFKYFTSDVNLDQKKFNLNYGSEFFQIGAGSIFNNKEKTGSIQSKYLFLDKKGLVSLDGSYSIQKNNDNKYQQGSGAFGLSLPITSIKASGSFELNPSLSSVNTNSNWSLNQKFGPDMKSSITQSNSFNFKNGPNNNSKSFKNETSLNLQQTNIIKFSLSNSNSQKELKSGAQVIGSETEKKENYELTLNQFRPRTDLSTILEYSNSKNLKGFNNGNSEINLNHALKCCVSVKQNIGNRSAIFVSSGGQVIQHSNIKNGIIAQKYDGSAFIQTSAVMKNALGQEYGIMVELEYSSMNEQNKKQGFDIPKLGASYKDDISQVKIYYDPSKFKENQTLKNTNYILGVEATTNLNAPLNEENSKKPKIKFD